VETGPIPAGTAAELQALKLKLARMQADDLPQTQAEAMAQEISAIRLQLKRLMLEREAIVAKLPPISD
jgi:hypothetical protein